MMGEGAGVVVLENMSTLSRAEQNLCRSSWCGLSGDAITLPRRQRMATGYRAMECALRNAQINIEDIDYINAGTSTPVGTRLNWVL